MSRKSDQKAEQGISGYKEQKYKGKSFYFFFVLLSLNLGSSRRVLRWRALGPPTRLPDPIKFRRQPKNCGHEHPHHQSKLWLGRRIRDPRNQSLLQRHHQETWSSSNAGHGPDRACRRTVSLERGFECVPHSWFQNFSNGSHRSVNRPAPNLRQFNFLPALPEWPLRTVFFAPSRHFYCQDGDSCERYGHPDHPQKISRTSHSSQYGSQGHGLSVFYQNFNLSLWRILNFTRTK